MDLTGYSSIGSALLVDIEIPDEPITRMTTWWKDLALGNVIYTGLGNLISITDTQNSLRATDQDLTLTIQGIEDTLDLVNSVRIKGSNITVRRYIFDPVTGNPYEVADNPSGRFYGIISNFTVDFSVDPQTRSGTSTIALQCSSVITVLGNKISGRKTTPEDQRRWFPGDLSMDRVGTLARSNFDFGVPR